MMKMNSAGVLLAGAFLAISGLWAQAADWKAGLARVDITPKGPIWQFGYADRRRPSRGVMHPLWAKALAIADTDGRRVVIVTTDLPGWPAALADAVCKRAGERTGLKRAQIVLNASHTHCGQLLEGLLTPGYRALVPPGEMKIVEAYTQELEERIVELIAACADLRPARLAYTEDTCDLGANRRKIRYNEDGAPWYAGVAINPDGPFDDIVPVLRVSDEEDKPLALLFGYACHNTTFWPIDQLNGDYAGFAQIALEKKYPGVQAMFMMGCGGDANPKERAGDYNIHVGKQTGDRLAASVERALAKPLHPLRPGPISAVLDRVELPFARPVTKEQLEAKRGQGNKFEQARTEYLLEWTAKHGEPPKGYPAPVQVVRLGEDLLLVALPGEPSAGYALRLRKEFPNRRLWIAGYCNDLFGYLCTERQLVEGGLEAGASQVYWGWPSRWADGVEDRIIGLVKTLIARCEAP